MKKEQLQIDGQIINYLTAGNGINTVLFIHGNSLSSETFQNQLNDLKLQNQFLIAIDLPGCGSSSDAAHTMKSYSLKGLVDLTNKFITLQKLKNVVVVGHSLGGHITMELLGKNENIKGVMVFGAPPLPKPLSMEGLYLPHLAGQLLFSPTLNDEQIDIILSGFFVEGYSVPDFIRNNLKRADGRLRTTMMESVMSGNYESEVDILNNNRTPLAIIHGSDEKLVNGTYFENLEIPSLWKNAVQKVENASHFPQMENPEKFNSLLLEFCNEID